MPRLAVPSGPQHLSPDWLTQALRSTGVIQDVAISNIEVEPAGAGAGFIGECVRITPTYGSRAAKAPLSMVAKFPSSGSANRSTVYSSTASEREIRFYAELAGSVSIAVPQVYYSALDEDSGANVMIMEDMSHAQNGDDLEGRPLEDALFCVRQLARLHADWWGDARLSEFPGQHQTSENRQQNFQRSWRLCVEQVGTYLSTPFITTANLLTDRIGEISSALATRPQTLIHGDFRYDNMFFGQGDVAPPLTLIDWQLVEYACPAYDLSYFAASSLHTSQRREIEDDLLSAYHDTLVEQGIRDYSLSDLRDDYRLSFIRFIELWIEAGAYLDLTNPRGHAYFLESIVRLDAVLEDHDIPGIIERRMYT